MAYSDLDSVKADLGINDNTKDSILLRDLDASTAFINSYLGYKLDLQSYDEYYDISDVPDNKTIYLKHAPIASITSVKMYGIDLVENEGYIAYPDYIRLISFYNYTDNFSFQGNKVIQISYTAGYETIPSDIEYVCRRMCVEMYNKKTQGNIVSESIGSWTRNFARKGVGEGLDPEFTIILDQYIQYAI